jgi:hypothetical protein
MYLTKKIFFLPTREYRCSDTPSTQVLVSKCHSPPKSIKGCREFQNCDTEAVGRAGKVCDNIKEVRNDSWADVRREMVGLKRLRPVTCNIV